MVSYVVKQYRLLHSFKENHEGKFLSDEQMKLVRKIYKKPFMDNRVHEIRGKLKSKEERKYINQLKINSVYWPESELKGKNEYGKVGKWTARVEGVICFNSFYVTRIDHVDILSKLKPLYTLPRVFKVNPDFYDLSHVLIPMVLFIMMFMALIGYDGDGGYDIVAYLTLLFSALPFFIICRAIYKNHLLYEVSGIFDWDREGDEIDMGQTGRIGDVPLVFYRDYIEDERECIIHGKIKLEPHFHIEPNLINHKSPFFSLSEKKRSLGRCLVGWLIITAIFANMTVNFYQSGFYHEFLHFTQMHIKPKVIQDTDDAQLSLLKSGDAIKLDHFHLSPGQERGYIDAYDQLDEPFLEQLTQSIASKVGALVVDMDHRSDFSALTRAGEQFVNQQGEIYDQLIAAKQKVKSQVPLKIEIGERKFSTKTFSLKDLQTQIFDATAYKSGQTLSAKAIHQQVRQALIGYLYGFVTPMHASVSFFRPIEKELVVYIYQPIPVTKDVVAEVETMNYTMNFYRFWLTFSLVMLIYTLVAYLTARRRYDHLTW
ncbi:hypothetical protein EA58_01400 [Photobacterium galatheae]|uniref:Uncharacterized protein n=2 Tax=Photobacterium galatheae TaxID=1654360 RepID=A0A066S0Z0_9GAMM|nr:hypothetical protein EA58_01400 [Photobacterium galatheae]